MVKIKKVKIVKRKKVALIRQPRVTTTRKVKRQVPGRMMLTPFEACVYGPVGAPGHSMGIPDGSSLQSIVIDHRQTFVVKIGTGPLAVPGAVVFAITPSFLGGFAFNTGQVSAAVYGVVTSSGLITTANTQVINLPGPLTSGGTGVGNYYVVPFREWLPAGAAGLLAASGANNFASFNVGQGRILTNKAKIIYTGSTMHNAGTCAIARQNIRVETNTKATDGYPATVTGLNRQFLSSIGPTDFTSVMQLAGSQVISAGELRCGYDVINVPYEFGYQPWIENSTPVFQSSATGIQPSTDFAQLLFPDDLSVGTIVGGPTPGIGHAPTTFVAFDGLDATASITVTLQSCIEYTVSFDSPTARFATMSPPMDLGAINRVKDMSRVVPTIKPTSDSWFTNLISGYGRGMRDTYMGLTGLGSKLLFGQNVWDSIGGSTRADRISEQSGGLSTRLLTAGMRGMRM